MVHQAAGGGHHNLGLLFHGFDLAADAGTAVEHRHPDILIVGQQTSELIANLNGQLPGGGQNQALHILALGVHMLNHGDAKGEGLAGAGRSLGDYVLPLQKAGDGLCLDGGGIAVALFLQCLQHGAGQAQAFKCNIAFFHSFISFSVQSIQDILASFPEFCNSPVDTNREFFIAFSEIYDRMGKITRKGVPLCRALRKFFPRS